MKKIIICLAVFAAAVCIFAGCSADKAAENNTDASQAVQNTQATQQETSTMLQEDTGKEIPYAITEDEAQKAAYEALKKQSEEGYVNSIENFTFDSITLLAEDESYMAYNAGYNNTEETENYTGHSYYVVSYKDNTQLCDFAYYCVDAMNGDLLYEGYMGD